MTARMYSNMECDQIVFIVSIVIYVALSLSLLIVGLKCNFTGEWVADKGTCIGVYGSGLILTFIIGMTCAFYIMCYIMDSCIRCNKPKRRQPLYIINA
jgi:hypothetical protein